MSIFNLRTFLFAGLFFPVAAQAAPAQAWTKPMTIASFIATDSGLTIVVDDGGDSANNPMSCTSSTWLRIGINEVNYALISSTILTAFNQGKPVKLWIRDCNSDGSSHFVAAWADK